MTGDKIFQVETLDFFLKQAPVLGDIALKYYGDSDAEMGLVMKSDHIADPVTKADLDIRDYFQPLVKSDFGDRVLHLSEESVKTSGLTYKKIIQAKKPILIQDELDGTKNFSEGKEYFSILLGMAEWINGTYQVTVGLVYKPLTNELFFATVNSDAYKRSNDETRTIQVSRGSVLDRLASVNVAIGRNTFPKEYPEEFYKVTEIMETFRDNHAESVSQNSKFACGLEVIDVAQGITDAYVIAKAANWDYAATSLILQQAGGKSYLAKDRSQLVNLTPWTLQIEWPGAYYPAFFTNGSIDQSLVEEFNKYLTFQK